jgi:hypothetical protein
MLKGNSWITMRLTVIATSAIGMDPTCKVINATSSALSPLGTVTAVSSMGSNPPRRLMSTMLGGRRSVILKRVVGSLQKPNGVTHSFRKHGLKMQFLPE